jgi:hypothetical protein
MYSVMAIFKSSNVWGMRLFKIFLRVFCTAIIDAQRLFDHPVYIQGDQYIYIYIYIYIEREREREREG